MSAKSMETTVWLIAGPTASGKSALALAVAERTGGEIVNADSMQVYDGVRLLTARPAAPELAAAPHHLYGVAKPEEAWSVGVWLRAAAEVLRAVRERGRPAIVVGGTGLYLRALTQGLAEIPPTPAPLRLEMRALWDTGGEEGVRDRLRAVDPVSDARIARGDRQRLLRALEVALSTGCPMSAFLANSPKLLAEGSWRGVVLEPPRPELYAKCDARLAAMPRAAVLDEVAGLNARRPPLDAPILKALGVREFSRHLAGEVSFEEALADAQGATRRYAKRQSTWFRGQAGDWPRLASPDPDEALSILRGAPR